MIKIKSFLFILLLSPYSFGEISLELPAVCDGVWESKTKLQQGAANTMSEVYNNSGVSVGRCLGWTNMKQGVIPPKINSSQK